MIVERWVFQIKSGRVEEAVALLLNEREHSARKDQITIGQVRFGPANRVIWACTYDNLAQQEQTWNEWFAERQKAFGEKWHDLREGESQREIWELA